MLLFASFKTIIIFASRLEKVKYLIIQIHEGI